MKQSLMGRRIEDMGLSVRAYRRFKHEGINTVNDLLCASDEVLEPFFDEVKAGMLRLDKQEEKP